MIQYVGVCMCITTMESSILPIKALTEFSVVDLERTSVGQRWISAVEDHGPTSFEGVTYPRVRWTVSAFSPIKAASIVVQPVVRGCLCIDAQQY